jgi:hypothetical protein
MQRIKRVILLLIVLVIFTFNSKTQTNPDISKYNCFTANIHYSFDGDESDGVLLFINHIDPDIPALQYSNVYLLNKSGKNLLLLSDSNAFISVYDMKVSPDSKYVAIYCVGEGHPWIEIYDLQKLINTKKQVSIADVNPYPGNVYLIGWQKNLLIVESDINLIPKNEGKDLLESDMLKKSKKYLFDPGTKKFKKYE